MVLPPYGVCDDVGRVAGGGDLRLPPPEHSHTVYCNKAKYRPVFGGEMEARAEGDKEVVGTGRFGFGEDADSGSGGGKDRGGRGDVQ